MSQLNGPNAGDWSVFADKMMAQRDEARWALHVANSEKAALLKALKALNDAIEELGCPASVKAYLWPARRQAYEAITKVEGEEK